MIASTFCKLQFGCVGDSVYVNCDDSKKDMTEAECNQKSGNILGASVIGHSYTKNGKCQKYTFMGSDTELLKRVIRSEEGTLTGYIRGLESQMGLDFPKAIVEDKTPEVKEEVNPAFMNNAVNTLNNMETSTTLN